MDIGMPRPDYDLLMQHANEWIPKPFNIIDYKKDPRYPKHFAKIQNENTTLIENKYLGYIGGIYLDIFPLDGAPDNIILRKIHHIKCSLCRRLLYLLYRDPFKHGIGIRCTIPLATQKLFNKKKTHILSQKIITEYSYNSTKRVMTHDDGFKSFPKDIMRTSTPIIFEGKLFNGVENTDKFLTIMYGDYMRPPIKEERHEHNHFFVDLNTPYSIYRNRLLRKAT